METVIQDELWGTLEEMNYLDLIGQSSGLGKGQLIAFVTLADAYASA